MRAELGIQAKKTRFIGENVIQLPETIEMLFYFLARTPGYRDRKKDVAVVPTVNLDSGPAEHNVARLEKCVARGDAFVRGSVVPAIRSIVRDNASIQVSGNVVGLPPVNSFVQHTKRVVAMELVVMLDQLAAREMVSGLVFH